MKSMTFNILCAGRGENHWVFRQKLVRDIIKKYAPDTFGLQEVHYAWMRYLINQFKDTYDFVGVGKDDGNKKGEYSPVFYNKHKFELLDKEDFWLSETPDAPSLGWDGAENRTCSYAVLKEKETEKVYVVFNTHLDHKGRTAQVEGMKLIMKKFAELNTSKLPQLLTADFNVEQNDEIFDECLKTMKNARLVAPKTDNKGTYNGWVGGKSTCIDHLFLSGFEILEYKTVDQKWGNTIFISDHYPVYALAKIKE